VYSELSTARAHISYNFDLWKASENDEVSVDMYRDIGKALTDSGIKSKLHAGLPAKVTPTRAKAVQLLLRAFDRTSY